MSARDRRRGLTTALPWLLLGLAFIARLGVDSRIPTPQVLPDEVIYARSAERIASLSGLWLPGQPPNFLYSLLVSPAWLVASMHTTYALVKAENALLGCLGGAVVYVWARRFADTSYALVALVLSLLLPALNLAMTVMTENAVYPAFLLALFALSLALERPTLVRQLAVLFTLGLVVVARVQMAVLLPVVLAAIAVKALLDRRSGSWTRDGFRRQLRLAVVLVLSAVAYVLFRQAEGRSVTGALGGYGGVLNGHYAVSNVVQWTIWQAGELVIAAAFLPVVAFIVVSGVIARDRASTAAERAFVAASVPAALFLVIEIGTFNAGGFSGPWIVERYTFYAAPLFFLGFALWLARGLPRPPALTALALAAAAALLVSIPLEGKVGPTLSANVLTLAALLRISLRLSGGLDELRLLLAIGVVGGGVLFVALPRRYARIALPALAAGVLVVFSYALYRPMRAEAVDLKTYGAGAAPTWIDDAVGGADVDAVYLPVPSDKDSSHVLLEQEFWNRRLHKLYVLGGLPVTTLPQAATKLDPVSGRFQPTPQAPYLAVPSGYAVEGKLVAQETGLATPLALYRVRRPARLARSVEGLYPDGWMGGSAAFNQYTGDRSGRAVVTVSRSTWGGPDVPGHVVVRVRPLTAHGTPTIARVTAARRLIIHSRQRRTVTLPTPRPPFRVEVGVDPTFSPSQFGLPDARQLGAQLVYAFAPGS